MPSEVYGYVLDFLTSNLTSAETLRRLLIFVAGCQSQGNTLEEVQDNIREAIELYLEMLSPDERMLN